MFRNNEQVNNDSKSDLCAFAACGEEFSCIVTRDRRVFAFGLGIAGQMGDGGLINYSSPTLIEALGIYIYIFIYIYASISLCI
jgi:alpha-tubulin suppressor-like RCC1 family protein